MMMFEEREGITDKYQEEETELESLIMSSSYYGGGGDGGLPAVTVVEYMVSSMSNELLCKFPDNSAFDFDYTQSSIWSPLLPHPTSLVPYSSLSSSTLPRKLSYDDEDDGFLWNNSSKSCHPTTTVGAAVLKKLTATIKDKISSSSVFNCFQIDRRICKKKKKMMTSKKKRRSSFKGIDNFSPIPSDCSFMAAAPPSAAPTPSKGWGNVLKAASRKFKKSMNKKDSAARLKLSNGLSSRATSFFQI